MEGKEGGEGTEGREGREGGELPREDWVVPIRPIYRLPSVPSVPSFPSFPSVPSVPSFPSVPSVPSFPSLLVVPGFWFLGIHWEKEWLIGLLSAVLVGASLLFYLRERATGKLTLPPSAYLLLISLYLATVALALKVAEIYDRMWYIYKDK